MARMTQPSPRRALAFALSDVGRLLKTAADQRARALNMTRAQWGVLSRLEQAEGLKQAELAEVLDIQPITLTRIIDRLCINGLVERRADPHDRRAKRLFLTAKARPLLARLHRLGEELMREILTGLDDETVAAMRSGLERMKDNLKRAVGPADVAA
jgi:MarR family transcriptional regulator for hemolysin